MRAVVVITDSGYNIDFIDDDVDVLVIDSRQQHTYLLDGDNGDECRIMSTNGDGTVNVQVIDPTSSRYRQRIFNVESSRLEFFSDIDSDIDDNEDD